MGSCASRILAVLDEIIEMFFFFSWVLIEVEVSMMASVGELKKAVEDVFSYSTEDDNSHHNISWYIYIC